MESASKKRKISHGDDDGEDDEEEKMEKFYALIKSIREARDRLVNSSEVINKEGAERKSKKRKHLEDEEKQVVVWKPSFQLEDFLDEAQLKKLPAVSLATTAHNQSKEGADNHQEKEAKEGLDLSLSL